MDGRRHAVGRGTWSRTLLRVLEHRRGVVRASGVLWLAAIVLAVIGWEQLLRDDPETSFNLLTRAYAVVNVLTVQVDVADVPLALALARLVAPLAAVTSVLAGFLTFGASYLHRRAARRASDHVLAVGVAERLEGHVGDEVPADHQVHLQLGDHELERALVRTPLAADPTTSEAWMEAGSASRARRVVIATGRDDLNLAALGHLLAEGIDPPEGVSVELEDRSAALRLTVRLVGDHPGRLVDVVCRDDVVAALAAAHLLERSGRPAGDERGACVAVVGDGPITGLVALRCAEALARRHLQQGAERRPALDVLANPWSHPPTPRWSSRLRASIAHQVEVTERARLGELLDRDDDAAVVAFVQFTDPSLSARVALELACADPANQVAVLLGASTFPAAEQITSIDASGVLGSAQLVGPLQGLDAEGLTWEQVAESIRTVERHGLRVVPSGIGGGGRAVLPRTVLDDLARPEALGVHARRAVPLLRRVGFAVVDCRPPDAS